MNFQPIIDILATSDFASLSDEDAASNLAAQTVVVQLTEDDRSTWITDRTLAGLFGYGRAAVILAGAGTASQIVDGMTDEQKGMALGIAMVLRQIENQAGDPPGLSLASAQAAGLITMLVGFGIITSDEGAILTAKASQTISWYSSIGVQKLDSGDINKIRQGGTL